MQPQLPFDSPPVVETERLAQGNRWDQAGEPQSAIRNRCDQADEPQSAIRNPQFDPPQLAHDPARGSAPQAPPARVFVRHPRAKRYLLRVTPDGTVRVTIPRGGSKREAAAFAEREHAWIEREQRRVAAQRLVRAEEEQRGERPSAVEARALREQAKRELSVRLLELAAQHGLTVTRISIRNQRSRWGSCSRSGHVCLNWRLVQMPATVRDYVLIHELMHLKRMDHSRAYWKLVAAACPEYKKARAWLRAQSAR